MAKVYGNRMKHYKDLDSKQKQKAVNFLFKRRINSVRWNGAGEVDTVKARLKEITERLKFCGCTDCDLKLYAEIQKDSVIKEHHLGEAQKEAESAFYPEDTDIIVKV